MNPALMLYPQALTRTTFAPFGDVIETEGAQHFPMNADSFERYYDLASVDVGFESRGRPVISIAQCRKSADLPLDIRFMERHPHGSQAFIPLFRQAMVVVVAPPGDTIPSGRIQAFYSNGRQGVNYRKGTWHLPLIALQDGQDFIIVDRGGSGNNCDEFHFDQATRIILLAPGVKRADAGG